MTEQKKAEVQHVNSAIKENKEIEKMVKQVISNGKPVSQEGRQVLKSYFSSVRGLNNLLGEKLEEPVIINGKKTKEIRDKGSKIKKKAHDKEKYSCQHCTKYFSNSSDLSDHVLTHTNDIPSETDSESKAASYPCVDKDKTNSKFSSPCDDLKTKTKNHTPNKRGPYKKKFSCKHCGMKITSQANLDQHMDHIHKIKPQREKAKDPSGTLVNSEKVKTKGQMKEHPTDKEIKCNTCGGAFGSQKQYVAHEKSCTLPLFTPEKSVPCDFCSEKFFNNGALAKHKEHCHK